MWIYFLLGNFVYFYLKKKSGRRIVNWYKAFAKALDTKKENHVYIYPVAQQPHNPCDFREMRLSNEWQIANGHI